MSCVYWEPKSRIRTRWAWMSAVGCIPHFTGRRTAGKRHCPAGRTPAGQFFSPLWSVHALGGARQPLGLALAVVHLAPPGASLRAPRLDELLESAHALLHLGIHQAEHVSGVLHEPVGVIRHDQVHTGMGVIQSLEAHRAGI